MNCWTKYRIVNPNSGSFMESPMEESIAAAPT